MSTEFNWFNVTTWALRDWEAALDRHWQAMFDARYDPERQKRALVAITRQRADYRNRILSWYRKLCLPMKPGEAVPNEVALLLAEEWDENTKRAS